ncbi:MAG: GDP-L-fucose synthase [Candidatus Marinimicrobia bacterium]|nr:GDP-L-fucose synthase [Candidatus Neomarinimicrobiota bacterium]
MNKKSKIYVAGHSGMVGSAIVRRLMRDGFENFILRTHQELNLIDQKNVFDFFKNNKPEYVIISAGKVGGIQANNKFRAEFLYENLMIQTNLIHSAYLNGVKKLLFLGSSCIYPRNCTQPIKEGYLLTGELEQTNEPYALAKIAGIKLCENYYRQYGCNFVSAMPTNLYGPGDNFDLNNSHVIPALLRKFHEAKTNNSPSVEVWGTGTPKREFLYVDDLADACILLLKTLEASELEKNGITHINVGSGINQTIQELADTIRDVVGFEGQVNFDKTKPNGTPEKLLDITVLSNMGWKPTKSLKDGLEKTYIWVKEQAEMNQSWALS